MKLEKEVYFIITKSRPIRFHMGDGNMEGEFEDAEIYLSKEEAENELSEFDEPENFETLKGMIEAEY